VEAAVDRSNGLAANAVSFPSTGRNAETASDLLLPPARRSCARWGICVLLARAQGCSLGPVRTERV